MLLPQQFDTADVLPSFEIQVENLTVGDLTTGPTKIPVSYDVNWHPVLKLGKFIPLDNALQSLLDENLSVFIELNESEQGEKLIVTHANVASDAGSVIFNACLQREPLVLPNSRRSVRSEAVLLDPPKFIRKPIVLKDISSSEFTLTPFREKEAKACLVSIEIEGNASDPLAPFSTFSSFLTFMKGSLFGVGNLFAFDESGEIAYRLLGFTRNDQGERQTNWFDIEIQNDLPDIYLAFSKAMAKSRARLALRQAINFYRASNVSRSVSLEMSIIASHSALESIVNHILEASAGWSQALMGTRSIRFSDKMRAAGAFLGLHGDILEHSEELSELSQSRNNIDCFELISLIRNKLVHQDEGIPLSGKLLHETWLVAQWLVEVFVFGIIGYRGKIIDRRVYDCWRGTTCELPLRA